MKLAPALVTAILSAASTRAALLVDYNAARGDAVSKMGSNLNLQRELEEAPADRPKANLPELYIKTDKDWAGTPAAHCHRKKGWVRAEYHALKDQTETGKKYYIGYTFAVNQLQEELVVFQWKEYNKTTKPEGSNIPFELRFQNDGFIALRTGQPTVEKPITLWTKDIGRRKVVDIGMEIVPKRSGGTFKMWYNGKPSTFILPDTGEHSTTFTGVTQPEASSPKWGAYRGEEVEVDTWIYQVQVGLNKAELEGRYFTDT